ncbi:MAG TPA: hypothetical protein VF486_04390 [Actinomycetes bacterium]
MPAPLFERRTAAVAAAGFALGCVFLLLQLVRLDAVPLRWNAEARQPQPRLDVTAPFEVGTGWRLDEALIARGIPARITPGHGYDGQWFLGLAYDPLLRDRLAGSFDMPRYRAGRPLQAMAGWLLAAGRTPAIPAALLLVGPLALALGAAASGRLLAAFGRSPWWGLGFALVPGVAVGVIFGTAEPLGLALAVLGLSLTIDGRLPAAAAAFAGAGLTKESYLVFAGAAALWLLWSRRPIRRRLAGAALLLGPGVAALGLWWAYVARMIPGSAADANAAEAVGPPLAGWAATLRLAARGGYVPDFPVGPFGLVLLAGSFALALAGVALGLRRRGPLDQTGLWLGLYGLVLSAALLGHFLSAMRALAPTVLATGLAVGAALPSRRFAPATVGGREAAEVEAGATGS